MFNFALTVSVHNLVQLKTKKPTSSALHSAELVARNFCAKITVMVHLF